MGRYSIGNYLNTKITELLSESVKLVKVRNLIVSKVNVLISGKNTHK